MTIQIREELADVIEGIAVENQSTYTGFGADLADASVDRRGRNRLGGGHPRASDRVAGRFSPR